MRPEVGGILRWHRRTHLFFLGIMSIMRIMGPACWKGLAMLVVPSFLQSVLERIGAIINMIKIHQISKTSGDIFSSDNLNYIQLRSFINYIYMCVCWLYSYTCMYRCILCIYLLMMYLLMYFWSKIHGKPIRHSKAQGASFRWANVGSWSCTMAMR